MLVLEDDRYLLELGKSDGSPFKYDWEYAKTYLPILKFFYDATLKISSSKYVTGNSYLKEVFGVGLMIRKMSLNKTDVNKKTMDVKIKNKFDKYWGDLNSMNLMIFVACVIDPRYKLKYVSWLIRESYGSDSDSIAEVLIMKVENVVEQIFKYYEDKFDSSSNQTPSEAEGTATSSQGVGESAETYDLDSLIEQHEISDENTGYQSELESYLGEGCVPRSDPHFNILLWWKKVGSRYMILSQMARDPLAIPVSFVAYESAFSTSGLVIDPHHSSLTPRTIETLLCIQDWIRSDYEPSALEDQFQQLEMIEEEFENSNEYEKLVKGVSLTLEKED